MRTKIKLLKDYKDAKIGDEFFVETQDAHQLVEAGIAEILVDGVELQKAQDSMQKEVLDAVEKAVEKAVPKVPATPKKEEKEKIPFNNIGEFFLDVKDYRLNGRMSEPLELLGKMYDAETKALEAIGIKAPTGNSTLIDTEGGFLVPAEFSTALMNQMDEQSVLAQRTFGIPINNNISLPYEDDFDRSASWGGGVTVAWGQEGATLTNSKYKTKMVELKLKKLHALVTTTDELASDSAIAFGTVISKTASKNLAKEFDENIVNGTGAGRPLGIMNAPCLISVTKTTSQTADTIDIDNVLNMWSRQANPNNAVWLIHRDALPQIYKLSLAVGTAGGANVFMFNIADRQSATIFGAPILWTEHNQTVGTTGDIICADLGAYLTATKAGAAQIKSSSSIHVRFLTDEQVFKFTMRVDGQPWWASARTPKHGSTTISPFVALASRD